jgi:hypothetical protein
MKGFWFAAILRLWKWVSSTYLKHESAGGKAKRQMVFKGERFDAVSVQDWRKKVLRGV